MAETPTETFRRWREGVPPDATPADRAAFAAWEYGAHQETWQGRPLFFGLVKHAIEDAVAAERERCAKIADLYGASGDLVGNEKAMAGQIADAIRSEPEPAEPRA